ncbi:MAG: DUF2124 domain-containing protein [Methanoregula sp.]|uniref:DUF2124 domain-containing protein n=1 Tax=Methanoregula sp. TaxID=2052170 RepID=UPI0025D969DA|nr:DUF2124 domain-containing protein [Methanoregula sp.]MCK9631084.1 DUF2124 domain-containing protein [Methanoregula sp.]
MVTREVTKSIPGILRPYKEFVQGLGLKDGDQIAYYGCVGTCTPFIEFNAVAVRGLHVEQVFVPLLDETKAKKIQNVEDVGMQVSGGPATLRPKLLVFMGGLAMPMMPVTKEQVRDIIRKHVGAKVAGICFMSMFEKAGWLDTVDFDLMIDATLDPVVVTRK